MFPKLAVVGVLNLRKSGPIRWRLPAEEGEKRKIKKKTYLVKVVLVELADEGSKIGVFEHPREDGLCELVHVLSREIRGSITSRHAERQLRTLTTKQSPFGPHETTLWKEGSSNILILVGQISAGMRNESVLVQLLDEVRCWRHVIL